MAGALVALVVGLALQAAAGQRGAIDELDVRFEERIQLASSYVTAHLGDVRSRQLNYARLQLSGPSIGAEEFDRVVTSFGFEASVLLDGAGVVLAVSPQKPSLVGTVIAPQYDHLSTAVAGGDAISNVVLSAAKQEPIVAVAVPFDTPAGRRVISGGYQLSESPLATFLGSTSSLPGREVYLVDANGVIIAGTERTDDPTLAGHAPELAMAPLGTTRTAYRDERHVIVATPVEGTPWTLVAAVPAAELHAPVMHRSDAAWALAGAAAALAMAVVVLLTRVSAQRNRLREVSRIDGLTGLANRARADEEIGRATAASARGGRPWAVAMIDIDRFKSINDRFGHAGGDLVLRHVAAVLSGVTRAGDLAARWGGEEFIVVMHDTDAAAAASVAERILATLREAAGEGAVTASVGIAAAVGGRGEDLVQQADAALYEANEAGRDRVVVAGRRPLSVSAA